MSSQPPDHPHHTPSSLSPQQPVFQSASLSHEPQPVPAIVRGTGQARAGLLLGCVGLVLFLLPILSVLMSLLLHYPIPSPVGVYLLPVSLFLSCLVSLAGIILSAIVVRSVEQAKQATVGLVLSGVALALSLMLGLLYLMAISSGFS